MSAKKSTIIFTKENPIYFSSFEDMKSKIATVNCKSSFYKFECEDCGKESIRPAHRNIENIYRICDFNLKKNRRLKPPNFLSSLTFSPSI